VGWKVKDSVQVSWLTSDNASNNDMAMHKLAKSMNTKTDQWDPVKLVLPQALLELRELLSQPAILGVWEAHT